MNRTVRRTVGTGIALAMFAMAACTPATEPAPAASTAREALPEVTPSASEAHPAPQSAGYSTQGILLGPVSGEGANERTTLIAGDLSHLLDYEESATVKEHWAQEEVAAAHEVATRFLVESILDSGYMWTEDREAGLAWVDDIDEAPGSGFKAAMEKMVLDPDRQQCFVENFAGWRPPADPARAPENGTEYTDVTINARGTTPLLDTYAGDFIQFDFEVYTVTPVLHPDGKGQADHHSKWHLGVSVGQDNGTWKVGGIDSRRWSNGAEAGQDPIFPEEEE